MTLSYMIVTQVFVNDEFEYVSIKWRTLKDANVLFRSYLLCENE